MIGFHKRYHSGIDYKSRNKKMLPWRIFAAFFFIIAIAESVLHFMFIAPDAFWYSMGVAMLSNDILMFLQKLANGYKMSNTDIYFWRNFKKHRVSFQEIHHIYVVNAAVNNGDVMGLPYILLIGGKESGVQQYCMHDRNKSGRLLHTEIEIMLISNHETDNNYGFVWNQKIIYKILKGYKGDYYVAESILNDFSIEYDLICEQYDDIEERVHVIEDY